MLVITRREGEEIVIGDPKNPIGVVRIASIRGDRVRVALDFPREVQVHRREIADQIGGTAPDSANAEASPATGSNGAIASANLNDQIVTRDVIGSIKPKIAAGR
ncbi:MAG: carbon storage regulator [Phycisphaerales bacterium]|nr:carbon storage regulator [Phycisphaerales bacterium]